MTVRARRKPRLVLDYWIKRKPVYACNLYDKHPCPHNYECETCKARRTVHRDEAELREDGALRNEIRRIEPISRENAAKLLESDAFSNQLRRDLNLYTRPVAIGARYDPPKYEQPARDLNFIQESMFSSRRWWK
jgi:hypothetical protein